jgi:hypothetical protein
MFLLVAILALIMILSSIRFAESPAWLAAHSRREEALRAVRYFLGSDVRLSEEAIRPPHDTSWREMLQGTNLRRAIFSGVPWACEGVGVYGGGVVMPVLIMALGLGSKHSGIEHIASSVELSAYVNIFVAIGFIIGLAIFMRSYHVRQQALGFILAGASLILLVVAYTMHLSEWMIIAGLIAFELFINSGPHLITFVLPSQIYPIENRGAGAGIAAACGKAGAVVGVFIMPLLIKWGGITLALGITAALQVVGAAITLILGRSVMPR